MFLQIYITFHPYQKAIYHNLRLTKSKITFIKASIELGRNLYTFNIFNIKNIINKNYLKILKLLLIYFVNLFIQNKGFLL